MQEFDPLAKVPMREGKVAIVTGGSSGIGFECARLLLEDVGVAVVAILARDIARLAEAKAKLLACTPGTDATRILTVVCDVAITSQCAAAVEEVAVSAGRVDLLINSAGVWVEGPSDEMREEDWDSVMDTNLKGPFFMARSCIPHLKRTKGQIINIASDAGLMGGANCSIYCASKGGLVIMTKSLALELAPYSVRVNAICPADVDTPMLEGQSQRFGGDAGAGGYLANLRRQYPHGGSSDFRFCSAQEVAELTLGVARIKAINGAALSIDFGSTAGKF